MKNHIEKIWIEKQQDEQPDTSCIGEYTDKKSDWSICVHCGEYVAIAEQPNRRAEEIEDEIIDLENDIDYADFDDEKEVINKNIDECKKELASLELHDCPHSSRNFNYFKPYAGGEKEGSEDYQTYGKQDFKRMTGLNTGNWHYVGIVAKAEIKTTAGTIQTIRSGGLWGIESDAGEYLEQVAQEQLAELREELTALGFGKRAIDHAFQNVETIEK
jgi:hypothetical protein